MSKIAVASENDMVSGHFGHCTNFNIFETEDGKIVKSESMTNSGYGCGALPDVLSNLGVSVIITGGIGERPCKIFYQKGIEVITGAQGFAQAAVESYLQGNLKSTASLCQEHHGECGHK